MRTRPTSRRRNVIHASRRPLIEVKELTPEDWRLIYNFYCTVFQPFVASIVENAKRRAQHTPGSITEH